MDPAHEHEAGDKMGLIDCRIFEVRSTVTSLIEYVLYFVLPLPTSGNCSAPGAPLYPL